MFVNRNNIQVRLYWLWLNIEGFCLWAINLLCQRLNVSSSIKKSMNSYDFFQNVDEVKSWALEGLRPNLSTKSTQEHKPQAVVHSKIVKKTFMFQSNACKNILVSVHLRRPIIFSSTKMKIRKCVPFLIEFEHFNYERIHFEIARLYLQTYSQDLQVRD